MNTMTATGTSATNTPNPHVLAVIRSAEQELTGLLQQRAEITRRMAALKQTLSGLAQFFGSDAIFAPEFLATIDRRIVIRKKGLTQACRLILMESSTPLRAGQGCEELQRRFPELARRHKDLRASVCTVFHRLTGYAEARCCLDEEGQRVWEWAAERSTTAQPNSFVEERTPRAAELRIDD
jgi:hypothetical protein